MTYTVGDYYNEHEDEIDYFERDDKLDFESLIQKENR